MNSARSSWLLALFLLFGVLVPTGCVLWFMNAAANSEGAAARRDVTEAYRGELLLLSGKADSFWRDRAATIANPSRGSEPAAFRRIVEEGLADSVVTLHYPAAAREELADPVAGRPDWEVALELERMPGKLADAAAMYARIVERETNPALAARAAQGQIRCLVRNGDKENALKAIDRYFVTGRLRREGNSGKRSIAADELLLALRQLKRGDARYRHAGERLAEMLTDYAGTEMPSAQRLFLMDELAEAFPREPSLVNPSIREAERLALQFLDADTVTLGDPTIQRTRLQGIWELPCSGGQVIALYRTETVQAAMRTLFERQTSASGVTFNVRPPGVPGGPNAIAAGPSLPGWQLSFALADSGSMEDAARRRIASYLWIGYLVVACLAVMGGLVGQWLRLEARLSGLKTDLVAAVSHELRTPLASMRLLVETLMDDRTPEPAKVHEYLALIVRENLRLSRLIENFLTFSRIERNRKQFVFAPTPAVDVIEKAIAAMGERLQSPACDLELEVNAGEASVSADEDALVTAMMNLLDNACKYTPEPRKISIRVSDADSKVVLAVSDNGIGIAPREHRRIFRRFYQVDQRLARETGGCGLGLSIVEFVVRAHGGTVRVESRPGAGSTFSVILPSARAQQEAA